MANLKSKTRWAKATNEWVRIHDIIAFVNKNYNVSYAENSRETFRKQALHHFRTAAIVEDNGQATNSPNYRYRLTEAWETEIWLAELPDHMIHMNGDKFLGPRK